MRVCYVLLFFSYSTLVSISVVFFSLLLFLILLHHVLLSHSFICMLFTLKCENNIQTHEMNKEKSYSIEGLNSARNKTTTAHMNKLTINIQSLNAATITTTIKKNIIIIIVRRKRRSKQASRNRPMQTNVKIQPSNRD